MFTAARFVNAVHHFPLLWDDSYVTAHFFEAPAITGRLEIEGRTAVVRDLHDEVHEIVSDLNNNFYAHGLIGIDHA